MKNLKKLAAMAAIFGTTYGANAFQRNFPPAEKGESEGMELVAGHLMVKSTGKIGNIDMPYTFVSTNTTNFASSGFAVKEMADANSVALEGNDVYFTRSSDDKNVYHFTVSEEQQLNGVRTNLEKTESAEPISGVLTVKDGKIYAQSADQKNVVELGGNTASSGDLIVPETLKTNDLYSAASDGIYVVTKDNIIRYDENGDQVGSPKVHGISASGHTPKDVVAINADNVFVLDTDGNLYYRSGMLFHNYTSVSGIKKSDDGKSLLITSKDANDKVVVSSYNTETKQTNSIYSEPTVTAKKLFGKKELQANGLKYFVQDKVIGYNN